MRCLRCNGAAAIDTLFVMPGGGAGASTDVLAGHYGCSISINNSILKDNENLITFKLNKAVEELIANSPVDLFNQKCVKFLNYDKEIIDEFG